MIELVFQSHGTINSLQYYEHFFLSLSLAISSTEVNFFPISFSLNLYVFFSLNAEREKWNSLKITIAVVTIQYSKEEEEEEKSTEKNTTQLTNYFHSYSGHDIYTLSRLVFVCYKKRSVCVWVSVFW